MTRTAKRHFVNIKQDGTGHAVTMISTNLEMNIAHAIRMTADLPDSERTSLAVQVLVHEEKRIEEGTASPSHLPEVLSAATSVPGIEDVTERLINAGARLYDAANEYEELDQFVALKDFIEAAPHGIDEDRIRAIGQKLSKDGDIIFDWDIGQADDDSQLDELDDTAAAFERIFAASLDSIHERIEEKKEELRTRFDEPPDDWYNEGSTKDWEATDSEIVEMFGCLSE